jgi:hypothetical protein
MRKKVISVIFRFLLLLLPVIPLCYAIVVQVKQEMIQANMKEKTEKALLHKVCMNETEVRWIKYGKEILINGRMFDIKSFLVKNGIATFFGLFDDEETALLNQIKKDHQNNTGGKQIVQLFKLFQFINNNAGEADNFSASLSSLKYPAYQSSSLLDPLIPRFFPPPQV